MLAQAPLLEMIDVSVSYRTKVFGSISSGIE